MSFRSRFRAWRRTRRRKRAAEREQAPLREFVYLDEVSVYSLIASKLGAIATEFTDTETATLASEVGGSVGVGAGGTKASIGSKLQSTEVRGSQVLRKSIVQTTFKELYELETPLLKLAANLAPPQVACPLDSKLAECLRELGDPWAVDVEQLARGRLVELEVELEAEPIYKNSAIITTMMELMHESPELQALVSLGERSQLESFARILERLLAGLVPVRAKAVDYRVVQTDERRYLVHRAVADQLGERADFEAAPLTVVGVAEETLFWKDIRRVLFSNSRYRILSRIARSGIQESWTPVKLAHVLADVSPELGAGLQMFNRSVAELAAADDPVSAVDSAGMTTALQSYATAAAEALGTELPADFGMESLFPTGLPQMSESVIARRQAFQPVTEFLESKSEKKLDPMIGAELRASALHQAGLDFDTTAPPEPAPLVLESPLVPSAHRYLDVEFIAIYW
ncbi:MAG: DUF6414 family protein [Nocardioides sp.]